MALTIDDIYDKEFALKGGGYDRNDVDQFLDEICDEMTNMQERIDQLESELSKARAEADQLIAENRIVDEARRRANAILDDAERRATELSASCYHGIMDMFDSAEANLRESLQNIDKGRQALYDITSSNRGDNR